MIELHTHQFMLNFLLPYFALNVLMVPPELVSCSSKSNWCRRSFRHRQ